MSNPHTIYEAAARLTKSDAGRNALAALNLLYSGGSLDVVEERAVMVLMESERSGYAGMARDAIREKLGKEVL